MELLSVSGFILAPSTWSRAMFAAQQGLVLNTSFSYAWIKRFPAHAPGQPSLSLRCVAGQSGCRMHFGWGNSQIHPCHSSTVSLALWARWVCCCKSMGSIQGERESLKLSKGPAPSVQRAGHSELTVVLEGAKFWQPGFPFFSKLLGLH